MLRNRSRLPSVSLLALRTIADNRVYRKYVNSVSAVV